MDKLFVALNTYGFNIGKQDFYHEWNMETTAEAMRYCTHVKDGKTVSGLPQAVMDEIIEVERDGIYGNGVKIG